MSLLDNKRKVKGYGNPEYFIIKGFQRRKRIRRDSVLAYWFETDDSKKEGDSGKYILHLELSNSEKPYKYRMGELQDAKDLISRLDLLFNVKEI